MKLYIKKIFWVLITLIFGFSCYSKYKVTKNGLKSNNTISGIIICKIDSIKSYDEWGIPKKVVFSNPAYKLHCVNNKKISFYKEVRDCYWVNENDTLRTLPFYFHTPGWYYVTGLRFYDRGPHNILYELDSNGKINLYYRVLF
jgi:hypothetical protein